VTVQPKRRLPLLPSAEDADAASRPAWQWVAFGALAIFVALVPLSALAALAGPALGPIASALGLALAALAGGFLVGRWGPTGVGVREAALAGLSAATLAVGLSWATMPLTVAERIVAAACVAAISTAAAAAGGKVGLRLRTAGHAS
jgi:hypothetical protein